MRLTELPLGLAGRAFRCAMPFSPYDPEGRALDEFRDRGVSVVVVLAEADECERLAQRDLRQLYRDEGFEVVAFPIRNFGVAGEARLREVADRVLADLQAGRDVAIHCYAGKGRTGTFAACLARRTLDLDGDAAIAWVRRYVPGAVETASQEDLVRRFT